MAPSSYVVIVLGCSVLTCPAADVERKADCSSYASEDPYVSLLQAATHTATYQSAKIRVSSNSSDEGRSEALHISASSEMWPFSFLHKPFAAAEAGRHLFRYPTNPAQIKAGLALALLTSLLVGAKLVFPGSTVVRAISLGLLYIVASASMIETNKWLMSPGNFPYPLTLTTNHMLVSVILANCLRFFCPAAFPALEKLHVSPWFCLKFVPIGAAFALSIVCGNGAYSYLSVSFLQVMKQANIVIIYTMSVICSLEALRRCSVMLLAGTLCGTLLAVHGEMHFKLIGFLLQLASSLSEAFKVIIQGILMSGSYKLDPLTMVLFMAPACLFANIVPLLVTDGPRFHEIVTHGKLHLPIIAINAFLAFGLNVIVAQCIKQLSPVGYLLCGIVKDVCIIVSSALFLGESLTDQQIVGFSVALSGVAAYSLYKQNLDCFYDDALVPGFRRVLGEFTLGPKTIKSTPRLADPESTPEEDSDKDAETKAACNK
jgi:drug/metabolite transporter (DMT)-like permease